MQYTDGFASASEVTAETRAAADVRSGEVTLNQFLPDVERDTLTFEFSPNTAQDIPAAVFRAFDTEAPLGSETSGFSYMGEIPPISQKMPLGEYRQLQFRQASATAIREAIMRKAVVNGTAIANRVEMARAQALVEGKFTLTKENGLTLEVDFQRNASHTVTAAVLWSNPAANVIGDLLAWQTVYRATNGGDASTLMTSSQVLSWLTVNTGIIAEARPGISGVTRVSPAEVRQVLASYGFVNIVVNDDVVRFPDGTKQRTVGERKVLLLPAGGGIGETIWGVPAEAFQNDYGIAESERAGIFGGVYKQIDPEGLYILSSSIVLPVLQDANATFAATV